MPSRWIIGIKDGLIDVKHYRQMGPAVWTYLALHRMADFDTGVVQGTPQAIRLALQESLGLPRTTANDHLKRLEEGHYIKWLNPEGLQITNYDSNKTFFNKCRKSVNGDENPSEVTKFRHQSDENPSPLHYIQYNRKRYNTLRELFSSVLSDIPQAKNPIAALRQWLVFVFGEQDAPEYGRLGRAAQRVGRGKARPGCRALAMRSVVAAVGRQIAGNVVDYLEKMGWQAPGTQQPQPKSQSGYYDADPNDPAIRKWRAEELARRRQNDG